MWSSARTGCRPVDEVGGESNLSADAPVAWEGRPISRLTKPWTADAPVAWEGRPISRLTKPWSDLRDKGGGNLPCVGKIERMK